MNWLHHYPSARLQVLLACVASYAICWYTSSAVGIPTFRGLPAVMLMQPSVFVSVLVVLLLFLGCTLLGTLIAGNRRRDAGLFAASFGLIAISFRGGSTGDVLRQYGDTSASSPYPLLSVELLLLGAIVALGWGMLHLMTQRRLLLKPDTTPKAGAAQTTEPAARFATLIVSGIAFLLLMMILSQSGVKKQAIASVGLSSFVATCLAYAFYPVTGAIWYILPPLVVGLLGMIWTAIHPGNAWQIGIVDQPLGQPLPIDYASAGVAAAILGYWMSRKWEEERDAEVAAQVEREADASGDVGASI